MNEPTQPQSAPSMGASQMELEAGRETELDQAHNQLAQEADQATNQVGAVQGQSDVASQSISNPIVSDAFAKKFLGRCCNTLSRKRVAALEKILSRVVPPEQAAALAQKAAMDEDTREEIVESGTEVARKWGALNLFSPEMLLITALGMDWLNWQDAKADIEAIVEKYAPKQAAPAPAVTEPKTETQPVTQNAENQN